MQVIRLNQHEKQTIDLSPEEFRNSAYQLVDLIADLLANLNHLPVAVPSGQRVLIQRSLPETGTDPDQLLSDAANMLFAHSTFNGHPRFWGYITSSAAPIGMLGDLLAAAINANVASAQLAPVASEIEQQTIRWITELIAYPGSGGILLSGGNMANISALWVARRNKPGESVRKNGNPQKLLVYASREVHTWLEKATDLSGIGTDAIRYIPTDSRGRLNIKILRERIACDLLDGYNPFMVIGNAGTVSTGAIDPLAEIADVCREFDLWFHVDGAYGAFAAMLPEYDDLRSGMMRADSIALDPHKWLYTPLEAGCLLVRDTSHLTDTFAYHPEYYHRDKDRNAFPDYYEQGPQNSRGFRALKIWLALQHIGRKGYEDLLRQNIALAQSLYDGIVTNMSLEAITHNLSIVTFRYLPSDLNPHDEAVKTYLNVLNTALLEQIQNSGEFFISNAVQNQQFLLRACIVNFRTTLEDVQAFPEWVAHMGAELDTTMRSGHFIFRT